MMGRMSLHTIISRLCNYFTSLSVILCNCHCFRVIAQAVTELDNKTTHRQWECGRIPGPSGVNLCIHTRIGSGPSNSITGTERGQFGYRKLLYVKVIFWPLYFSWPQPTKLTGNGSVALRRHQVTYCFFCDVTCSCLWSEKPLNVYITLSILSLNVFAGIWLTPWACVIWRKWWLSAVFSLTIPRSAAGLSVWYRYWIRHFDGISAT